MDAEGGMEGSAVTQPALQNELWENPNAFEFFQAVRALERLYPDRAAVGGFGDPIEEVARFSANPSIAFPASEIQTLDLEPSGRTKLTVNFMGLIGPLGVLPHYYTLLVADRYRARDRGVRDFLDIFNHRMVSLFYRAWEKYRFTASYERDARDPVSEHLSDLIGLGTAGLQDLFEVRDESLLFYTGLLAPVQRPAVALEQLIGDYFDVPAEIEQFVGGWYPLSISTQCSLGDESGSAGRLGTGAVVGDEIWDQQARVRIRLGPLTREQYDEFLPTGSAYSALRTLARHFSDDRFDFEVQLILAQPDVRPCVLGAEGEDAATLGWSTWIRSVPFARDADETILTL
jgi:type VI secretion system protein ImpH